jgi:DNA-binding MltR family transcriptional regulator
VIIIASILEEMLRRLHEAHIARMIYPSRSKIMNDLCAVHAPLSSFAGLIQVAYAYGLIAQGDYSDLQVIRKLRNEAAHTFYEFSLSDGGIVAMTKQLTAVNRYQVMMDARANDFSFGDGNRRLPEMKDMQRSLIINALALQSILQVRLADAIQGLLERRQAKEPN